MAAQKLRTLVWVQGDPPYAFFYRETLNGVRCDIPVELQSFRPSPIKALKIVGTKRLATVVFEEKPGGIRAVRSVTIKGCPTSFIRVR